MPLAGLYSDRGMQGFSRQMLRSNRTYLLDFRAGQSVGVLPDSQPENFSPMAMRRSGLVVVAATSLRQPQGDVMTKARTSKVKLNSQRGSEAQSTTARQVLSDKSSIASRPKAAVARKPGKIDKIIAMMRRPKGATINDLTRATGWQTHSVRGAISGMLRKKQGLNVISEKSGDARLYRIADVAVS